MTTTNIIRPWDRRPEEPVEIEEKVEETAIEEEIEKIEPQNEPVKQVEEPGEVNTPDKSCCWHDNKFLWSKRLMVVDEEFTPFPTDVLPKRIAEYVKYMSETQSVDETFIVMPVLATIAIAMGNAFRIAPKEDWVSPPNIWAAIIAPPSWNKSRPMKMVLKPLMKMLRPEEVPNAERNPQGRLTMGDATIPSIVKRLQEVKRGCGLIRDELAGWTKSFDAFKKGGGGDEQAYIEFWSAGDYHLDRKTDNEQVYIPAASLSVLGSIQPKIHMECMGPGKFESGLVQRLLVARPPKSRRSWVNRLPGGDVVGDWEKIVNYIKSFPFKEQDLSGGGEPVYVPNTIKMEGEAQKAFQQYFEFITDWRDEVDETAETFIGKSDEMAARLALLHHGMKCASEGGCITDPISYESVMAGIQMAYWCACEQLRVYGMSSSAYKQHELKEMIFWIESRMDKTFRVRDMQRKNYKRFPQKQVAVDLLNKIQKAGLGSWDKTGEYFTMNE